MNTQYVKLRSWHVVDPDKAGVTLCSKPVGENLVSDHFRLDQKSCETCLRLNAHFRDAQAPTIPEAAG